MLDGWLNETLIFQAQQRTLCSLSRDPRVVMAGVYMEDCAEVKSAHALAKKATPRKIVFAPKVSSFKMRVI